MQKLILLGLLPSLLMLTLPSQITPGASTQTLPAKAEIQYAAKFICGRAEVGLAAPGEYFTIVNVHNPSPSAAVQFRKKFALARPDEQVGKVTPFFQASLKADEAMAIDCPNIYTHTGIATGTFVEGYVVIQTPAELDVVSVYTAGSPVATLHTERVPPRRLSPPCEDLNLNLGTGGAPWQVTQDMFPGTGEPRPASVIAPGSYHPSWATQLGSVWVGLAPNGFGDPGKSKYEVCFCLCTGFSNTKLTLKGMSDEKATVYLNNTALSPSIGSFNSPTTVQTTDQQLFKEGTNCVTVVVDNSSPPSGINFAASVTATAGRCP